MKRNLKIKNRFVQRKYLWSFSFVLAFVFLSACGTTRLPIGTTAFNQKTSAGYIPNRINGGASYGTVFFDATKRSAVTTITPNDSLKSKYLAEEQPDAAVTLLESVAASVTAESSEAEIKAMGDFTKELQTSLETLTVKSHSLNYLRTSLYRLNEAAYNGVLDSASYHDLYIKTIENLKELHLKEFEVRKVNSEDVLSEN